MTPTWILPLTPAFAESATLAAVGGKGANLARLVSAGFRIPRGFLITTNAYRAFVQANHLEPIIHEALTALDLTANHDPDTLQALSTRLRAAFAAGQIPPEMTTAVQQAYGNLNAVPIAVRSSATAEDLPDLSFAGQQDTFLNVVGLEALVPAIIACWSSLWTARAIGYRARNRISAEDAALAVVVQQMVQSEASGVLFTANPLTGLRSESVIDATLGLGEALVSGLVEPDHYVVDGVSGQIISKKLGAKALIIHSRSEGGVEQVAASAAEQQALPDAAIVDLAALGCQVAALYQGAPQDIEWAWAEERLYLLQSRPITSLFPLPSNTSSDPLLVLGSVAAMQGMLDPLTPLGQDTIKRILMAMAGLFGARLTPENQRVALIAGERMWVNLTGMIRHPRGRRLLDSILSVIEPSVREALAQVIDDPRLSVRPSHPRPRTLLRAVRVMSPVAARLIHALLRPDAARRRLQRSITAYINDAHRRSQQATTLPTALAFIDYLLDNSFTHLFPRLIPRLGAGMACLNLLFRLARPLPNGEQMVIETTRGLPHNVTTEMDLALWQAAQKLQTDSAARAEFGVLPAAELAQRFLVGELSTTSQSTLAAFLGRYGIRGLAEIDLGRKRWADDPTPVMQAVQSYMQITQPEHAPDAVFARGAAAGEAAIETLALALQREPRGWLKARLARWAGARMRSLAGLRETPKFTIISLMALVRRVLMQCGRQLVAEGVLTAPEDVFFLNLQEIGRIAQAQPATWQALVAERRIVYEREKRRTPIPRLLLSDGRAFYEGLGASARADEDVILGSPVSQGATEGTVRVVFDPHQAQLLPGEILVCPGTDPSWTPLFLAAGGLIMEVGGMMTHGSVVAREYGIPAVVGVHQATTRLRTGDRVRMNGSTGEIVRLRADAVAER